MPNTLTNLAATQLHGSDMANVFGGGELTDYLINFVNTLDPNGLASSNANVTWPKYSTKSPQLITFLDGDTPVEITQDDYRKDAIKYVGQVMMNNPV